MKTCVVIVGAGAIGRGYLPWVLPDDMYEYHFIDSNPDIINLMNQTRRYQTYRAHEGRLESKQIRVASARLPGSDLSDLQGRPHLIVMNVGPRNVENATRSVSGLTGPMILCENDPKTVQLARECAGRDDVYFAVPDVITSNTAPEHLLREDPLALVTESGELFVDRSLGDVAGVLNRCTPQELGDQWTAKLFLHNTPHCVAAYLGALCGTSYIHEAMGIETVDQIVEGCMLEMQNALKLEWSIDHSFIDWYAAKELSRFRNPLLYDPIERVAREPLRKLEADGRLLGAAQKCLAVGFIPDNILLGICAALSFDNPADSDHHLPFMRGALSSRGLLSYVLGLRQGEALEMILARHFDRYMDKLEEISNAARS